MNELKKYINKYLDYKGLLYYHKNLLNLLEEKWGKLKEEHNILDEYVDSYLNSVHYNNYDFNKSFVRGYAKGPHLGDKYIQFSITFSKNLTGHFVLIKSRLALDAVDVDIFDTLEYAKDIIDINQITINNVIPNLKYYWVVFNNDLEILESGTVDPIGTRMFYTFPTAYNVRDLGGIPTNSGLHIKFGKLIRGSEYSSEDFLEFQELSPAGTFNKFYFLDLRNDGDMGYHFDENYHNSPLCTYSDINENTSLEKKEILADAINYVLDKIIGGYTVYFHCKWGAHRTGLLSSILLSLLDVPQCEIDKDYELTSFDKDYDENECLHRNDDIHGYKSGNEYIRDNYNSSWKNYAIQELGISEEKIEAFKDEMIIDYVREQNIVPVYFETTYKKLKNMKDRGVLTPGAHYRMIDYETIVGKVIEPTYSGEEQTVVDADSANHKFDLLLLATSKNSFDSKVKALHSGRDTENYFINDNLSKWQLWYDIDNNKNKYNWVSDNCKGVIYRMIDERGNDLPYDFKNILLGEDKKYTFSKKLIVPDTENEYLYVPNFNVKNNVVKPWIKDNKQCLNFNIFEIADDTEIVKENYLDYHCRDNYFTGKAINNRFNTYCYNNTIMNGEDIVLNSSCVYNIISNSDNVKLGKQCTYDVIDTCKNLTIESYISNSSGFNHFGGDDTCVYAKHGNSETIIL